MVVDDIEVNAITNLAEMMYGIGYYGRTQTGGQYQLRRMSGIASVTNKRLLKHGLIEIYESDPKFARLSQKGEKHLSDVLLLGYGNDSYSVPEVDSLKKIYKVNISILFTINLILSAILSYTIFGA
jgi:hypothetical protein